jgi:hypothetical protein
LIFARQMSRRPERALPLGVRSAQNKQFMMRQREKFCKLISQRADGECGMKNALSGERDSIRKAETRREKRGGEGVRARAWRLFPPGQVRNFIRNRQEY